MGLEGYRAEHGVTPPSGTAFDFRHGAVNPVTYARVGGGTAAPRRTVVDNARCNACHGELTAHGNNRNGNVQYCVTCHNPRGTDAARRPMTAGAPATIDFGVMVHRIHMGEHLPSVQAGTPYVVYGFGNTAHDYSEVRYPRTPADCASCHAPEHRDGALDAHLHVVPRQPVCHRPRAAQHHHGGRRELRLLSRPGPLCRGLGLAPPRQLTPAPCPVVTRASPCACPCSSPRARGRSVRGAAPGAVGEAGVPGTPGTDGDGGATGPRGRPVRRGRPGWPRMYSRRSGASPRAWWAGYGARRPVRGGTVYLVPGTAVAQLARMPIDLAQSPMAAARATADEPLEDLVDPGLDAAPRGGVVRGGVPFPHGAGSTSSCGFRPRATGCTFPAATTRGGPSRAPRSSTPRSTCG